MAAALVRTPPSSDQEDAYSQLRGGCNLPCPFRRGSQRAAMPATMDALSARTCTAVDTVRSACPSARCLGPSATDASNTRHRHAQLGGRELPSASRNPCSAAPSLSFARPHRPGSLAGVSHAALSRHGTGGPGPSSLSKGHLLLLYSAFLPGTQRLTSDSSGGTRLGILGGVGVHGDRRTRGTPGLVKAMVDIPEAGPLRDALFATAGALTAFTLSAGMAWVVQRNNRKVSPVVRCLLATPCCLLPQEASPSLP